MINAIKKRKGEIVLIVLLIAIILINLFVLNKPSIFGLVTGVTTYSDSLSLKFNQSINYSLELREKPLSVKLSGYIIGNGSFKIYIEQDDRKYLVLDKAALEGFGTPLITGMAATEFYNVSETGKVSEMPENVSHSLSKSSGNTSTPSPEDAFSLNETKEKTIKNKTDEIEKNKTTELNKTEEIDKNKTIKLNKTEINKTTGLNKTEEIDKNKTIEKEIKDKLKYKSNTQFDVDDNGIESVDWVVDFEAKPSFNWDVDEDYLCTRWEVYSLDDESITSVCYGNADCCAFMDLKSSLDEWDAPFDLYYGQYGAAYNNRISARVVYVDLSNVLEPDIAFSNWDSLDAKFVEKFVPITRFEGVCVDSCSLIEFDKNITLVVEADNVIVNLTEIRYKVMLVKENVTNVTIANVTVVNQTTKKIKLKSETKNFKSTEIPNFEVETSAENIVASLIGPNGNELELENEVKKVSEGNFTIELGKKREFRAGLYKLRIKAVINGSEQVEEQDFAWGVLAINTHKSVYLENEESFIGIAVLNDLGKMVCDSEVILEIVAPDGEKTILTTEDGDIMISPECEFYGVTNLPDYYTYYAVGREGTYLMNLTAVTPNGVRSITDEFVVQKNVEFDVAREGPTRIYPAVPYAMNFTIKANRNYDGPIIEYVPASFEIKEQDGLMVTDVGNEKRLAWNKELTKGETYNLYYEFDAPDISPYFFVLGELQIGNWQEYRYWQIASDLYGTIKFYDEFATLGQWKNDVNNDWASTGTTAAAGAELGRACAATGSVMNISTAISMVTCKAGTLRANWTAYETGTMESDDCVRYSVYNGTGWGSDIENFCNDLPVDSGAVNFGYIIPDSYRVATFKFRFSCENYDSSGGAGEQVHIMRFNITCDLPDTKGPSWSLNQTNKTATAPAKNDIIQLNITVSDANPGVNAIKLATNNSGPMQNESGKLIWGNSTTTKKAIFNFTVTAAKNKVIKWQVWANDSDGNVNVSRIMKFVVRNRRPNSCSISRPLNNYNYTSVFINYTCTDADGDALKYYVYINRTLNQNGILGNVSSWAAADGSYNVTVSADDGTANSTNATYVKFIKDTKKPSFRFNKTNSSPAYRYSKYQFNISVNDSLAGGSFWVFSWNNSGVWDNRSNGTWSGKSRRLNVTKTITAAVGKTVAYRWYANDSAGNKNTSLTGSFVVEASDSCTPPGENNDWKITDACIKTNQNIDLGTGDINISTGGSLILVNTNITFDKLNLVTGDSNKVLLNISYSTSDYKFNQTG